MWQILIEGTNIRNDSRKILINITIFRKYWRMKTPFEKLLLFPIFEILIKFHFLDLFVSFCQSNEFRGSFFVN